MDYFENFWEMEPLMRFVIKYFEFRDDKIRVSLRFATGKDGKNYMKAVTIENKEI